MKTALRVAGAVLLMEAVMIALAFGWVAFVSYGLDPGRDPAYYEAYAQRSSPVVALVAGAPVFGAFGWLCARRAGERGARFARTTTIALVALDAAFFALAGASAGMWGVLAAAATLKLGGVVLGGRLGARAAPARS
jgi:hypothetical protein